MNILEKMMSRNLKSLNKIVENNKDDIINLGAKMGSINAEIEKNTLDQNEDKLKDIATKKATISEEGTKIYASALKAGFTGDETTNVEKKCPYCGSTIDHDSKFCKICGKEQ